LAEEVLALAADTGASSSSSLSSLAATFLPREGFAGVALVDLAGLTGFAVLDFLVLGSSSSSSSSSFLRARLAFFLAGLASSESYVN
jgi:hypothetical protein